MMMTSTMMTMMMTTTMMMMMTMMTMSGWYINCHRVKYFWYPGNTEANSMRRFDILINAKNIKKKYNQTIICTYSRNKVNWEINVVGLDLNNYYIN